MQRITIPLSWTQWHDLICSSQRIDTTHHTRPFYLFTLHCWYPKYCQIEHIRTRNHFILNPFDDQNCWYLQCIAGIFESLIDSGISVVATSNRAPWDLNLQGVHEAIFAHFKAKLMESCDSLSIECNDFRRQVCRPIRVFTTTAIETSFWHLLLHIIIDVNGETYTSTSSDQHSCM